MKIQINTQELKVLAENIGNGSVKLTFPELHNATAEIHSGKHINSVRNWKRSVPHGNSKQVKESYVAKHHLTKVMVSITEMLKVDESRYPDQIKYRLVVDGNFGENGYCTTGDMRLSKESFKELTKGITPRVGKNFRRYEL